MNIHHVAIAICLAVLLSTLGTAPMLAGETISVPATIDSTGTTDVSTELAAFIGSVADGATIEFAAGGTYRLDAGLRLIGRRDLTFVGNGSTLHATPTSGEPRTSPFMLEGGGNIVIRDFTLLGTNPDSGTGDSHHRDRQNQGGVNAYGVAGLVIERTTTRSTWGDCVYLGADRGTWSDGVTYRDSTCEGVGRMGITIVAARNVLVERVSLDEIALSPFDIEPIHDAGGAEGVTIQDNVVGTYGHSSLFTSYFFAAEGDPEATVRDVTIARNRVTGGTLTSTAERPNRANFTFIDNVSLVPATGTVLHFEQVDGVTVSGNVQPLEGGSLMPGPSRSIVAVAGGAALVLAGLAWFIFQRRRRTRPVGDDPAQGDPPGSGTAAA